MSWEESSLHSYKCPCGSSTYTITTLMDDWNRTDERWKMVCVKCKQRFRLYRTIIQDSGSSVRKYQWVRKDELELVTKFEKAIVKAKSNIIRAASSRYLNKWLSLFENIKSKRVIWKLLTDNGNKYPSATTFYKQISIEGIQSYLTRYIDYETLPFILSQIGAKDKYLISKIESVKQTSDQLEKAIHKMLKHRYK